MNDSSAPKIRPDPVRLDVAVIEIVKFETLGVSRAAIARILPPTLAAADLDAARFEVELEKAPELLASQNPGGRLAAQDSQEKIEFQTAEVESVPVSVEDALARFIASLTPCETVAPPHEDVKAWGRAFEALALPASMMGNNVAIMDKYPEGIPPLALCVQGTDVPVAWSCALCDRMWREEYNARVCCSGCGRCGRGEAPHPECQALNHEEHVAKKEALLLVKAKRVPRAHWKGAVVFSEAFGGQVYVATGEAHGAVEKGLDALPEDAARPSWCWGTYEHPLHLDAADLLENALGQDEVYDGAIEAVRGEPTEKLEAFAEMWNAQYGSKIVSHVVDYDIVVVLDDVRFPNDYARAVKILHDEELRSKIATLDPS